MITPLDPYKGPPEVEESLADQIAMGKAMQAEDARLGRAPDPVLAKMISDAEHGIGT